MDTYYKHRHQNQSLDVKVYKTEKSWYYKLDNGTIYTLSNIDELRELVDEYGEVHWGKGIDESTGEVITDRFFVSMVALVEWGEGYEDSIC